MRENIILKCTECGEENYINTKNKRNHPERVEFKKYCSRCNKKTTHKELFFYCTININFGSNVCVKKNLPVASL